MLESKTTVTLYLLRFEPFAPYFVNKHLNIVWSVVSGRTSPSNRFEFLFHRLELIETPCLAEEFADVAALLAGGLLDLARESVGEADGEDAGASGTSG